MHGTVQLKGRRLRIQNIWNIQRYLLWAFSILPVGVVMCTWAVEQDEVSFLDLSVTVPWRKRLP